MPTAPLFSDPIINLVVNAIISAVVVSPFLWLAGRALVGREKAKFTDAFLIVFIGIIANYVVGYLLSEMSALYSGLIGLIIQVILWLAIVKHFFDCGWLKALAITIFTIIIFVIILIVLGFIGLAIWWTFF